ncbi:MAG: hypothetical protein U9R79_21655 [Armatimonadota bacterium]|nr:hypothetical protein [Armatimonadota bacterium]
MSDQPDLNELWEQARQRLLNKMEDLDRPLWDAAQIAQPLVLDEDTFVLGVPPGKMADGSHLTATTKLPIVREAVSEVVGRRVEIELVEGTDPGAWEREKQRRAEREEMAERRGRAAREAAGVRGVWQDLYEEISELFGSARERRFPVARAQRLGKALLAVRDAEARARQADPEAEEVHHHQLNRAIDRIATLSELPGTMVAVEYMRVKSRKEG